MDEAEYRRKVAFWSSLGMVVTGAGAVVVGVLLVIFVVLAVRG